MIISVFDKNKYQILQMNNQKTSSSMIGDNTDIRYQKALKEITKLISLNNELKEEAKKNQQIMASVKNQIKQLTYQLQKVNQQKQQLEIQHDELTIKYRDLQQDYLDLDKVGTLKKQQYRQVFLSNDIQNIRSSNDSGAYMKKIQQLQQRNSYLQNKVEDMDKIFQWKNKDLLTEIAKLKQKLTQAQEVNLYLNKTKGETVMKYSSKNLESLSKDQLVARLKLANLWHKNTQKQCVQLKIKLHSYEARENVLSRIKSQRNLPKISSVEKIPGEQRNYSEIMKRLKISEEERKSITKKYEAMKNRLEGIDEEISDIVRENEKNQKIMEGYEKLIQKQQGQIENLVKDYEDDMKKATEDFKERLIEQRQNFGPNKNNKQIKMLQALQHENKSLKKKFQLCSSELTKCFRALQIYKAKLAEYEQSFTQLVSQNQRLAEKITSHSPFRPEPSSSKKQLNSENFNEDDSDIEIRIDSPVKGRKIKRHKQ